MHNISINNKILGGLKNGMSRMWRGTKGNRVKGWQWKIFNLPIQVL